MAKSTAKSALTFDEAVAQASARTFKKETLKITGVQLGTGDRAGDLFIQTAPTTSNPKGNWAYSGGSVARLMERVGIPNALAFKAIVGASHLTNHLTMETTTAAHGDYWVNEKTGEYGRYGYENDMKTEKEDAPDTVFIKRNEEIVLGEVASAKIADIAMNAVFANAFTTPVGTKPVAQPVATPDDVPEV